MTSPFTGRDLVPPVTGTYYLGTWGSSGYTIILGKGNALLSFYNEHRAAIREVPMDLKGGREAPGVEVLYRNHGGDADMELLCYAAR